MVPSSTARSANIELVAIYFVVFGISIIISIGTAFLGGPQTFVFSNNTIGYMVGVEIITGYVAWIILNSKGWKLKQFNLNISTAQTLMGLGVFAADYAVYYVTELTLKANDLFQASRLVATDISLATAMTASLVNPLFEELFVVAYTIERAERIHGKLFTIALSAFVRFLYHLYQGPVAVWVFVIGILHACIYTRWRKLWPIVAGHAILDFIFFRM